MLLVLPLIVNGTELSAFKFLDALGSTCSMQGPPGVLFNHLTMVASFPTVQAAFAMRIMSAKRQSRYLTSYNEIRDKLIDLASKAYSPSAVPKQSQPGSEIGRRKQGQLSETPLSQQPQ